MTRTMPTDVDKLLFKEVVRRGAGPGGIRLAAQLFNLQPCERCGFVWYHCHCQEPKHEESGG